MVMLERLVILVADVLVVGPLTLRVVGVVSVSRHGCFSTLISSLSATILRLTPRMHRPIPMDICALLLLSCLKERTIVLRDRDLLALTGHLNDALVVVSLSYPTSVALVRPANDDDHFAYFGVTSHSVLAGDGLAAGGTFHKLFSQQNDILTVHHEETI